MLNEKIINRKFTIDNDAVTMGIKRVNKELALLPEDVWPVRYTFDSHNGECEMHLNTEVSIVWGEGSIPTYKVVDWNTAEEFYYYKYLTALNHIKQLKTVENSFGNSK